MSIHRVLTSTLKTTSVMNRGDMPAKEESLQCSVASTAKPVLSLQPRPLGDKWQTGHVPSLSHGCLWLWLAAITGVSREEHGAQS